MSINIDREALERLVKDAEEARSAPGYARCPDCGCMLGLGAIDHGYGDYRELVYCQGNCGYEEIL